MQSDILKNIAAPSLKGGIPPKAFGRILKFGLPLFLIQQFEMSLLIGAGLYIYYFRKTQINPFFMEEDAARKAHGKTVNIHSVEGNYYSA